jgi:hypothetical protein
MAINTEGIESLFDSLMGKAKSYLQEEYDTERLTGHNYSNVYLQTMQLIVQQATSAVQQQELNEAQIEALDKDNEVKSKDIALKDYELSNILPTQKADIESQTSVRNEQSSKDLLVKQSEIDFKTAQKADIEYTTINIKPKELEQINEQIDLLQSQDLSEQAKKISIDKDTDVKERQTIIAENASIKDLLIKSEQVTKLQEEIDLLQTQDSELQANGTKDRALKDKDIALKDYQRTDILPQEKAIKEKQVLLTEAQTDGFKVKAYKDIANTTSEGLALLAQNNADANYVPLKNGLYGSIDAINSLSGGLMDNITPV